MELNTTSDENNQCIGLSTIITSEVLAHEWTISLTV